MGIIFARFRKKESTYDQLEKLDSQIKAIEEYGKSAESAQRKVGGYFMLITISFSILATFVGYFYKSINYVVPLIFITLAIFTLKKVLTWWYNRKLRKNLSKLSTLKEEKKKMLDSVMETETYKVAKKILEKFAPDEVISRKAPASNVLALPNTPIGLRYRGMNPAVGRMSIIPNMDRTPLPSLQSSTLKIGKSMGDITYTSTPCKTSSNLNSLVAQTPRLPMARMILPQNRSALDKIIDYLVGDGPSNRYALICKQCSGHNGMAMREEFEYLSFHCCYCKTLNPAKKQRPPAPKLNASRLSPLRALENNENSESTSESEKNSPQNSDSDVETKKSDDGDLNGDGDKRDEEEPMDVEETNKKD